MKITIGSDHAGFALKSKWLALVDQGAHEITDNGCYTPEPVDFPDIAQAVTADILQGKAARGIMFCGTGVGAAIACNKVKGIRAAVCHDIYSAHQCVEHDDVQILCLGGQIIGHTLAYELIEAFLKAEFSTSEEFRRRVEKLRLMEEK